MSLKKYIPLLIIAPVAILIDQLSKLWIIDNIILGQTIPILESLQPYLQITRTTNTGFAFGLASDGNTVILVLAIIITIVILWMYASSKPSEGLQRIAFAMVIGGAIGNIIDRIRFDHVVDFVHITIPGFISNVSNFADHFVVVGVIILLIDSVINGEIDNDESNQLVDESVA